MAKYRTIKALVLDYVHRKKGVVDEDRLAKAVLRAFPASKWKRTHWAWYRSQMLNGRFTDQFTAEERRNLKKDLQGGPTPRDLRVKKVGDRILSNTRAAIRRAAGAGRDFGFKINRWIYSRLQQDELRDQKKKGIRKQLWTSGPRRCHVCDKRFPSLTGVQLHRKNAKKGYSIQNCQLLCSSCHRQMPE